jgi:hypothetical protein
VERSKQYGATPFRTDRVASFFLSRIPDWINHSNSGRCFLKTSPHFLNYEQIYGAYGLSYEQMVNLQMMINEKAYRHYAVAKVQQESVNQILSPQLRSQMFYESLDRVQGGVKALRVPEFNRVNLIWIDLIKDEKTLKEWLLKIDASELGNNGIPIIASFCKTKGELEFLFSKLENLDQYIYFLGAESFSIYDQEFAAKPKKHLFVQGLLKDKQVTLLAPEEIKDLPEFEYKELSKKMIQIKAGSN